MPWPRRGMSVDAAAVGTWSARVLTGRTFGAISPFQKTRLRTPYSTIAIFFLRFLLQDLAPGGSEDPGHSGSHVMSYCSAVCPQGSTSDAQQWHIQPAARRTTGISRLWWKQQPDGREAHSGPTDDRHRLSLGCDGQRHVLGPCHDLEAASVVTADPCDQRMRRPRRIDLALAGCRGGMMRSVAGSSSGTTRRGPYESLARCA